MTEPRQDSDLVGLDLDSLADLPELERETIIYDHVAEVRAEKERSIAAADLEKLKSKSTNNQISPPPIPPVSQQEDTKTSSSVPVASEHIKKPEIKPEKVEIEEEDNKSEENDNVSWKNCDLLALTNIEFLINQSTLVPSFDDYIHDITEQYSIDHGALIMGKCIDTIAAIAAESSPDFVTALRTFQQNFRCHTKPINFCTFRNGDYQNTNGVCVVIRFEAHYAEQSFVIGVAGDAQFQTESSAAVTIQIEECTENESAVLSWSGHKWLLADQSSDIDIDISPRNYRFGQWADCALLLGIASLMGIIENIERIEGDFFYSSEDCDGFSDLRDLFREPSFHNLESFLETSRFDPIEYREDAAEDEAKAEEEVELQHRRAAWGQKQASENVSTSNDNKLAELVADLGSSTSDDMDLELDGSSDESVMNRSVIWISSDDDDADNSNGNDSGIESSNDVIHPILREMVCELVDNVVDSLEALEDVKIEDDKTAFNEGKDRKRDFQEMLETDITESVMKPENNRDEPIQEEQVYCPPIKRKRDK